MHLGRPDQEFIILIFLFNICRCVVNDVGQEAKMEASLRNRNSMYGPRYEHKECDLCNGDERSDPGVCEE